MRLADLNPAKYNPRKDLTPADSEYQHIKNSIEDYGYIDPIIVNVRNNVIVGGHQRFKILVELGHEEAHCVLVDFDEATEKGCNAALNKAQGDWDQDALDALLQELDGLGVDMARYGFETDILDEDGDVQEDNYDPEATLEEPPSARLGDVYALGHHRVMCGDSTSSADVEALMGGALANLTVTDPPYNVDYQGTAGKIKNDNMEDTEFYGFLLAAFNNAHLHSCPRRRNICVARRWLRLSVPESVLGRRLRLEANADMGKERICARPTRLSMAA